MMRDFVLPFLDSIGKINHSYSKTVKTRRRDEIGEWKAFTAVPDFLYCCPRCWRCLLDWYCTIQLINHWRWRRLVIFASYQPPLHVLDWHKIDEMVAILMLQLSCSGGGCGSNARRDNLATHRHFQVIHFHICTFLAGRQTKPRITFVRERPS